MRSPASNRTVWQSSPPSGVNVQAPSAFEGDLGGGRGARPESLVERQRLDQVVLRVMDVGEVDQRGHEPQVDLERLPVRRRGLLAFLRGAIVQRRRDGEVLLRRGPVVRIAPGELTMAERKVKGGWGLVDRIALR
mgnify:CR=1 FL=1